MSDHLAILRPTYLRLILEGAKSIECRLTRTSKPPFGVLKKGQRIYLKESSGPVRGVARAGKVVFRRINASQDLAMVRQEYGEGIMAKDDFWESNGGAKYCTLIFLEGVRALPEPFRIDKKDMRGWVVLDGTEGFAFPQERN